MIVRYIQQPASLSRFQRHQTPTQVQAWAVAQIYCRKLHADFHQPQTASVQALQENSLLKEKHSERGNLASFIMPCEWIEVKR